METVELGCQGDDEDTVLPLDYPFADFTDLILETRIYGLRELYFITDN